MIRTSDCVKQHDIARLITKTADQNFSRIYSHTHFKYGGRPSTVTATYIEHALAQFVVWDIRYIGIFCTKTVT